RCMAQTVLFDSRLGLRASEQTCAAFVCSDVAAFENSGGMIHDTVLRLNDYTSAIVRISVNTGTSRCQRRGRSCSACWFLLAGRNAIAIAIKLPAISTRGISDPNGFKYGIYQL